MAAATWRPSGNAEEHHRAGDTSDRLWIASPSRPTDPVTTARTSSMMPVAANQARRKRTEYKLRAVADAIQQMQRRRLPVTYPAIASRAGVRDTARLQEALDLYQRLGMCADTERLTTRLTAPAPAAGGQCPAPSEAASGDA
jgi:hypothetical protein